MKRTGNIQTSETFSQHHKVCRKRDAASIPILFWNVLFKPFYDSIVFVCLFYMFLHKWQTECSMCECISILCRRFFRFFCFVLCGCFFCCCCKWRDNLCSFRFKFLNWAMKHQDPCQMASTTIRISHRIFGEMIHLKLPAKRNIIDIIPSTSSLLLFVGFFCFVSHFNIYFILVATLIKIRLIPAQSFQYFRFNQTDVILILVLSSFPVHFRRYKMNTVWLRDCFMSATFGSLGTFTIEYLLKWFPFQSNMFMPNDKRVKERSVAHSIKVFHWNRKLFNSGDTTISIYSISLKWTKTLTDSCIFMDNLWVLFSVYILL